jgi:hypothetical protein
MQSAKFFTLEEIIGRRDFLKNTDDRNLIQTT